MQESVLIIFQNFHFIIQFSLFFTSKITLTKRGNQGYVRVRHYWFYIFWIPRPRKPCNRQKTSFYSSQFSIYWWPIIYARWPWPNTVTKVTWWSDIIDFTLYRFLDPKNDVIDNKNTFPSLTVRKILMADHLRQIYLDQTR